MLHWWLRVVNYRKEPMSDSPLLDTPTPPSGFRLGSGHPHPVQSPQQLQTQLSRIAVFAVVGVVLLAAAGVAVIVTEPSWAELTALSVVAGCVVVILAAVSRAAVVTRAFRPVQQVDPGNHSVPVSMTGAQPTAESAPVPSPRPRRPAESPPAEPPRTPSSAAESGTVALGDDFTRRREVFGKLARRLQSLVNRAISRIDRLEREVEDPELLKGLYEIDHLVTRVRRQAENLAVLGGEAPQRRSDEPISVYAVLRSAVAEIEHYKQVTIVPTRDINLHGHIITEVIHLLAELLENATSFTAPDSPKVVLRAEKVTAGLAIEVQDRGLGMPSENLQRINRLLDGSASIDLTELLQDGRIGLAVVKELAQRHNVRVQLQTNIFGGIDAAVVLPHDLISDSVTEPAEPRQHKQVEQGAPGGEGAQTASIATTVPAHAQRSRGPAARTITVEQSNPGRGGDALTAHDVLPGESHSGVLTPESISGDPRAQWAERDSAPAQPAPELPMRHPGTSFSSAPSPSPVAPESPNGTDSVGSAASAEAAAPAPQPGRPPLPHRRGESHLHPELREPTRPTTPIPGHNADLMATIRHGLDRGYGKDEGTEPSRFEQIQSTEDSRDGR